MPSLSPLRLLPVAVLAALALAPAGVAHAQGTVHASPPEAQRVLFVAGDARRLSRNPSGTVDTVLEKILQALYRDDPTLAPEDAKRDVASLRDALGSTPASTPATLAVLPGNQRVLAVLAAFHAAEAPDRVKRAVVRVADAALTQSSASDRRSGREFAPATDSLSTLLYGGFSPAATLGDTADLARSNARFGRARDLLWATASHESVFDGTAALIAGNPALRMDALHVGSDGSLMAEVADLEALVRDGLSDVGAQTTHAIADHRELARQCPGANCQDFRDAAQAGNAAARDVIAARQATVTAAGGLLNDLNSAYGAAAIAEAQASAQVASAVNAYFAGHDYGQFIHAGVDVAGLAAVLSVAEVDPSAAITGVLNVVRDFIDIAVPPPDADALILQGLQGVSQQLSAFAQETAAQFRAVDARLEALNRQVATLASQLSAQLAEVRGQLTGLGTALSDLQSSVDRLHSEIQRLFEQNAINTLRGTVSESVGYTQNNGGRRLSAETFSRDAALLFDNATATSLSSTVLASPLGYNAPAAAAIGDIDTGVNFFATFPQRVTDAPKWPATLASTTLPSPDYWAASARAFAQLLLENRDYATPAYATQLRTAIDTGRSLADALAKIGAKDTDADTGSTLFNSALGYSDGWVGRSGDRPADQPPTLLQALRAERAAYLEDQRPQGIGQRGRPWIDPWGGAFQPLGDLDILGNQYLQNNPSFSPTGYSLPNLRNAPELISRLPIVVQNAIRLEVGRLNVTWRADFGGDFPAPGGAGSLHVMFGFDYYVPPTATRPAINDRLGTINESVFLTANCSTTGGVNAGAETLVNTWNGGAGCSHNLLDKLRDGAWKNSNIVATQWDASGFQKTANDLQPLVEAKLRDLQAGSLRDLVGTGATLTHGRGGPDTDVAAAAQRVEGAQALLRGYVNLGLPQALGTDDTLRGLVAGEGANALAHPYFDAASRAVPADNVPGQLANYVKYLLDNGVPQSDILNGIEGHFTAWHTALAAEITAYVKTGRAAGQDAGDGSGRLDEANPLVSSTLDRLELSRAVLADALAHPPAHGGGEQPQPQPGPTAPAAGPTAPAAGPTVPAGPTAPAATRARARRAASRARIVRAPRVRGRAVTFTVAGVTGTSRITASLVAARRIVGRAPALTVRAGARRTVTVRLSAAGRRLLARRHRLRVTVKIAAGGRPLGHRALTLR